MFKFYRVKELRPNINSVQHRLPQIYKNYLQSLKLPPAPLHYIPHPKEYVLNPGTKQKMRVETRPIPLKFPKEADEGIWGGEGVIQGFVKNKWRRRKMINFWISNLKKAVVYSEILNQYMSVTLTERTLRLIDENSSFDHYILSTPVQDLKSQLALSIRRKMYFALLNRDKNHPDDKTNEEIIEKYKKYIIPKEEAEWFGLTMREAVQKQRLLEEEQQPVPLKHALRLKLIEELKQKSEKGEVDEEEEVEQSSYKSWLRKLNPFTKKEKEEQPVN
ncbi:large ribosomal subunit protein bL28m [Parasteatoda tepidariorum]|uniref:large ribosomal subunit protein bL28m n=1 Tax=Parasteatoda tepidariorum TaxID=114398 RepID=UPI00077FC138|nr:39S ribosomal protein L28, mitochondrial [Parasteatoda tepidariorum]